MSREILAREAEECDGCKAESVRLAVSKTKAAVPGRNTHSHRRRATLLRLLSGAKLLLPIIAINEVFVHEP